MSGTQDFVRCHWLFKGVLSAEMGKLHLKQNCKYIYINLQVLQVIADSMIPHDFFRHPYSYFAPLFYIYLPSPLIRILNFFCPYPLSDHFNPVILSSATPTPYSNPNTDQSSFSWFLQILQDGLSSEDVRQGSLKEKELITSVFLSLSYFTQYDLFQAHSFTRKFIISFIFTAEYYHKVYTQHIFIIHLSVERNIGCFLFLAIVNRATMNAGEQVSVEWDAKSMVHVPRSGTPGSYGRFSLS